MQFLNLFIHSHNGGLTIEKTKQTIQKKCTKTIQNVYKNCTKH